MAKKYWLMKCEPEAYTIERLEKDGVCGWEGVRNYQARNFMRDQMQVGDGVLFYASNADPSGVTGLAEIARAGYPDPFAFKKGHHYYDPESTPDKPTWYTVDREVRRALSGHRPARTAEADARPREHDGDSQRRPALDPAGDEA